ncbi:MAG: GNAT family N-acetyltransferase [Leadbetterella sp.]|nr:GNAT family N-acetyltransferase [Leadbetterella sp.]
MKVQFIDETSKHLVNIIELGTKNSSTLGFLPEGAFIEHARKKWIIIAEKENKLVGYLLFRLVAKDYTVSITHLCIHNEFRGQKFAPILIDYLKENFKNSCSGIVLSCRKDYVAANKVWQNYGFVSKLQKRSRSKKENYLIKWFYDFYKENLFSFGNSDKIKGVLDANIIIRLRDGNSAEDNALVADWLTEEIDYYFVPETYNEVQRDLNFDRAEVTRKFLRTLIEVKINRDLIDEVVTSLKSYLPGDSENDESDRKQIAQCISSGIEYFITRDGNLLSNRNEIENNFPISILSPSQLILEIDRIKNTSNYFPSRLAGTIQTVQNVNKKDYDNLIDKFINSKENEHKKEFKCLLEKVIENYNQGQISVVSCPNEKEIGFWGFVKRNEELEVHFLRVSKSKIGITLFTQLISEIISKAIEKQVILIKISDPKLNLNQKDILSLFGFVERSDGFFKIVINDILLMNELYLKFPIVDDYFSEQSFNKILELENIDLRNKILVDFEKKLFPLKFKDIDIPCYIIPIKPYWAGQLFEKNISNADIFGADPSKIWNKENVYFRNVKPVSEAAPARILWYLSSNKNYTRQKGIVAASYLDFIDVDQAKNLYNRYKKYGIYEWKDILKLAENDPNSIIKAIRFSDSDLFENIVPYAEVNNILFLNGREKNTFTSPLKVSNLIFNEIYSRSLKKV